VEAIICLETTDMGFLSMLSRNEPINLLLYFTLCDLAMKLTSKTPKCLLSDGKCECLFPTYMDSINCEVNHNIFKVRKNSS